MAVRMVSEGVDIPRLRVGVFATVTTTDLFFRQAVGRFVRWVPGVRDQRAWLYIADYPRLRVRDDRIAEHERHPCGERRASSRTNPGATDPGAIRPGCRQLSMFEALSATPIAGSAGWQPWQELLPDDWRRLHRRHHRGRYRSASPAGRVPLPTGTGGPVARPRMRCGRERGRSTDIARLTGQTHAQVNGQLNRIMASESINDATVEQLQARLAAADRWFERLRS